MKISNVILPAAGLIGSAQALTTGFAVPATVAPGSSFRVVITSANYIQSVQDVAFSFGLTAPASQYHGGTLGQFLSTKYIGPDNSNIVDNFTHFVTIPANAPHGPAVFTGALFSLAGAVYGPQTDFFWANVTVGDSTSGNLVGSTRAT